MNEWEYIGCADNISNYKYDEYQDYKTKYVTASWKLINLLIELCDLVPSHVIDTIFDICSADTHLNQLFLYIYAMNRLQ